MADRQRLTLGDAWKICRSLDEQMNAEAARMLGNARAALVPVVAGRHLNADIVREMRRCRGEGMTYRQIGEKFGVAYSTARAAVVGLTWGDVE